MKAHSRRRALTFGDFVSAVYDTWGKRRAKGVIKFAVAVRMIEFRDTEGL